MAAKIPTAAKTACNALPRRVKMNTHHRGPLPEPGARTPPDVGTILTYDPFRTGSDAEMTKGCERVSEVVLLAMALGSPWAFGAVPAWAEVWLYAGIALVAVLGALSGWGVARPGILLSAPSVALVGLVGLALLQTVSWPGWLVARGVPSSASFQAGLAPARAARLLGETGSALPPPGATISQCPDLTRDAASRLAAGWALFLVVAGRRSGAGALRRLGLALAANGVLLAVFAVTQALSWNGRLYWVGPPLDVLARGGPFVNKNHLAAYLNLGLGFALALEISPARGGREAGGRGLRLAAYYSAGLIAVGVIASLSRGGFVAMLAATSVLVVTAKPGMARTGGGLLMLAGLVAVFLVSSGVALPSERLGSLLRADPYADRLALGKAAVRAWSDSPVYGQGLGTFAYSARFFHADDGSFAAHPENEYLEVLADGGVVGLALALLLLASVTRLGGRALASARDARSHAPALGVAFGLVALAVHCLCDFPLHVPAVAVVAVMLAAHMTRAGRDAGGEPAAATPGPSGKALALALPVVASLLALAHGVEMARSEAEVRRDATLPPAGYAMPTPELWDVQAPALERAVARYEAALRYRPDWAEGHARMGIIRLSQYRRAVLDQIRGRVGAPAREEAMADPVWLHEVVHTARPGEIAAAGGLLAQDLVRRHLVPAARAFLEARRCCPVWALPHAELATLDYLIRDGEPASVHARRALRLAGPESLTLALAARAAAQAGDPRLAARCWRRMVEAGEGNWAGVAGAAAGALTSGQILDWVIPDGRAALRFSGLLYDAPVDRPARDRFLRRALELLPGDRGLPEADRLALEARALSRLGDADAAGRRMAEALALEPAHAAWRNELIGWLIGRGKYEEAHDLAVVGLYYAPSDPDARRAAEAAVEALVRGSASPVRGQTP